MDIKIDTLTDEQIDQVSGFIGIGEPHTGGVITGMMQAAEIVLHREGDCSAYRDIRSAIANEIERDLDGFLGWSNSLHDMFERDYGYRLRDPRPEPEHEPIPRQVYTRTYVDNYGTTIEESFS